ncbi:MAG: sigma 54-interacting transcriptional regulator, partial [Oscillospiraceae bacterium]|nr:sigma 54-interacting transcriptional regulator [Oscillospiraceae bacterium]
LSRQVRNQGGYVYESEKMREVVAQAIRTARSDATVLIMGETGCGKEILADIIQSSSDRADQPYIKVNCAALPEHLLESELFGYERGAFTGADPRGKAGMFELANGGTILLDEIGEIPLAFQAKLLRALQNRQIIRVGGTKTVHLDVRIIASTNRDLKEMMQQSTFREDLYYRLNVLPLYIPPLRDRPEDIEVLVRHYLKRFNQKYKKSIMIDPLVYFKLRRYSWPGNIRELENILERWSVVFEPYTVIRWEQVSYVFTEELGRETGSQDNPYAKKTMAEIMDDYQREVLQWANREYGTVREMAQALDIDHTTIVKKAKRLGISLDRHRKDVT